METADIKEEENIYKKLQSLLPTVSEKVTIELDQFLAETETDIYERFINIYNSFKFHCESELSQIKNKKSKKYFNIFRKKQKYNGSDSEVKINIFDLIHLLCLKDMECLSEDATCAEILILIESQMDEMRRFLPLHNGGISECGETTCETPDVSSTTTTDDQEPLPNTAEESLRRVTEEPSTVSDNATLTSSPDTQEIIDNSKVNCDTELDSKEETNLSFSSSVNANHFGNFTRETVMKFLEEDNDDSESISSESSTIEKYAVQDEPSKAKCDTSSDISVNEIEDMFENTKEMEDLVFEYTQTSKHSHETELVESIKCSLSNTQQDLDTTIEAECAMVLPPYTENLECDALGVKNSDENEIQFSLDLVHNDNNEFETFSDDHQSMQTLDAEKNTTSSCYQNITDTNAELATNETEHATEINEQGLDQNYDELLAINIADSLKTSGDEAASEKVDTEYCDTHVENNLLCDIDFPKNVDHEIIHKVSDESNFQISEDSRECTLSALVAENNQNQLNCQNITNAITIATRNISIKDTMQCDDSEDTEITREQNKHSITDLVANKNDALREMTTENVEDMIQQSSLENEIQPQKNINHCSEEKCATSNKIVPKEENFNAIALTKNPFDTSLSDAKLLRFKNCPLDVLNKAKQVQEDRKRRVQEQIARKLKRTNELIATKKLCEQQSRLTSESRRTEILEKVKARKELKHQELVNKVQAKEKHRIQRYIKLREHYFPNMN